MLGQIIGLDGSSDPAINRVSLLMGVALLFAGLTIVSHERQQTGFQLLASLSMQVLVTGLVVLVLGLLEIRS